jgi:hypothetical protein
MAVEIAKENIIQIPTPPGAGTPDTRAGTIPGTG